MGPEKIGVRVEKIINRYGVAKHFLLLITDNSLSYDPHSKKIEAEAHLDEIYVIRTSVCAEVLYHVRSSDRDFCRGSPHQQYLPIIDRKHPGYKPPDSSVQK